MSKIFSHFKLKYSTYQLYILYTLIPLLIYGTYKNGFLLYFKHLVQFMYILKPLIIVFNALLIGLIITKIFKLKNYNLIIYNVLISFCISINVNIFILMVGLVFLDMMYIFVLKKIHLNFVAIGVLTISLISYLIKSYTFLNHYEIININSFDVFDYLLGRGIGGVCSTSVVLILLALIFLANLEYFKKDIALYGILIYFVCSLWGLLLVPNIGDVIMKICSYSAIFGIVYVATLNEYSPKLIKERFIYTSLIAILTFIFTFVIESSFAIFISILIVNILEILKKLFLKKGN